MIVINVAKDFSDTPGGRYRKDGKFSGEEFREDFLIPKYLEAKEKGEKLQINIDGCYGFCDSFLAEVFNDILQKEPLKNLLNTIKITSSDPKYTQEIKDKILNALIDNMITEIYEEAT